MESSSRAPASPFITGLFNWLTKPSILQRRMLAASGQPDSFVVLANGEAIDLAW